MLRTIHDASVICHFSRCDASMRNCSLNQIDTRLVGRP